MSEFPSAATDVLTNATRAQLEQAAAHNHRELFYKNTLALKGDIELHEGLAWTYCGPEKESMIPFPSLQQNNVDSTLDKMMEYYRAHPPKSAGCWSLDPPQPNDLGIKLLARGFQPGWKPNWLALDLTAIKTDYAIPPDLLVKADNETSTENIDGLPYAGENGAVSMALMQANPGITQRFIAKLDGNIVGQSCVFFSSGELGTPGIYNVGVVPEARQQGIGKAVVLAACLYAKECGYHYAVLNGTGQRMYEQLGFEKIGDGLTWWLTRQDYLTRPPDNNEVIFVEAIGKADLAILDEFDGQVDLKAPIANGMTLMQLAVHCNQPMSAEWLVEHGAEYNVADAWGLGWKERAASLLAKDPAQVNRLHGNGQLTVLHMAVEKNDIDLVRLLLSAGPDLSVKDKFYDATALDWAMHLKREEIAGLIRGYEGVSNRSI